MSSTTNFFPRLTFVLTGLAPWLFAFLLVGCNFQAGLPSLPGLNQDAPKISLEIPQGYAPARSAAEAEKSWEQVALDAERMAFHGAPLNPSTEKVQPKTQPSVSPIVAEAKSQSRIIEVLKPGKISRKWSAKKGIAKKRYASTGKFWKPVKLTGKRFGEKKSQAKKLALNF